MSKQKRYEYHEVEKKPVTSVIPELDKLGLDGWRVVCSPSPNTYLLVRELKD